MSSNLTINHRTEGDVCVIVPSGYLDDHGGEVLLDFIESQINLGYKFFVIDFTGTPVINSQGIAHLLETTEIVADEIAGAIGFTGLTQLSYNVFQMIGLLQMGTYYQTPDEAIAGVIE
ncbi:MAG: STAS domain-containing protein [Candidatus Riflebacteria bacterium]|nr:STAS domain-containing protein [Candidatus Riflebacteria bacterium]